MNHKTFFPLFFVFLLTLGNVFLFSSVTSLAAETSDTVLMSEETAGINDIIESEEPAVQEQAESGIAAEPSTTASVPEGNPDQPIISEEKLSSSDAQDVLYYWNISYDGVLKISSHELPTEPYGGAVPVDPGPGSLGNINISPWFEQRDLITSAVVGGEGDIVSTDSVTGWFGIDPESFSETVYYYPNLTSIDLTYLDTSNVTSMKAMFANCISLTKLTLGNMDTSNVKDMSFMFCGCRSLTTLDLRCFDTSNVKNMYQMFTSCSSLENLDVSSLDTSNVISTSFMFGDCSKLKTLDLSSFDVSNVTIMSGMFYRCSALTSLDLSEWNAYRVKKLNELFCDCSNLSELNLEGFTSSNITEMDKMFFNCQKLESLDLSSLHTSNVMSMKEMFSYCNRLTSLDVSGFDTSNVKDMEGMFSNCDSLTSLDVSSFNTSKAANMKEMFSYCNGLTSLDVSGFDTSNVNDMEGMFSYCDGLTSLDVSGFNTAAVVNMRRMFYECRSLTALDVSGFDTSQTKDMRAMFYYCCSLPELDVSSFDTSNVTDLSYFVACCHVLTSIDLSSFKMDHSKTEGLFAGCRELNTIISPDTVSSSPIKLPRKYMDSFDGTVYTVLPAGRRKLETIAVSGITLDRTGMTLSMGGSARLTATVTPSDAYMKEITWSTSDKYVAAVTADGTLTAVGGGRAIIKATTKDGGYTASCTVTVKNLAAPELETAGCVYGGVSITWKKVNGARKYRVYRKESGGSWEKSRDTELLSFTDRTVVTGKTYIYTVRCISYDGSFSVSSYNPAGLRVTYTEAPEITAVSNVYGGVKFAWTRPEGAVRFRFYRKTGSGSWSMLGETTGTSWTDKTAVSGTSYTYTVRCMSADSRSYVSSFNPAGRTITYIAAPGLESIANVYGGVKVTWSRPAGSVNFRVYRREGTDAWRKLGDTSTLNFTDGTAVSGTTYSYIVRCISTDGRSYDSAYVPGGKSITYIAAPVPGTVSSVYGGVKFTWTKPKGAVRFRIYRRTGSGSWSMLGETTGTSCTDKTAVSGTSYTYTVRCISADSKSYTSHFNSTGKTITYIAAPELQSVSKVTGGVKVTWRKPAGAVNYRVYRKSGTGNWEKLADTTLPAYTDKSVRSGTTYTYTVRCIRSDGKASVSAYDYTGKTIKY